MLSVEFNIDVAKEVWISGFEDGMQQGIQRGMLIKQIEMLKEFNVAKEKIIERIKKDFNISENEIKKYL